MTEKTWGLVQATAAFFAQTLRVVSVLRASREYTAALLLLGRLALVSELLYAGVEGRRLDSTRAFDLNEDAILAGLRKPIGHADFGRQNC